MVMDGAATGCLRLSHRASSRMGAAAPGLPSLIVPCCLKGGALVSRVIAWEHARALARVAGKERRSPHDRPAQRRWGQGAVRLFPPVS